MPGLGPDRSRLGWLDGLRGLAALQVVLMHYVFAFMPAVAMSYPLAVRDLGAAEILQIPFVFAYNGHAAVCLFFIMSGVVLTRAFAAQPFAVSAAVARRLIRLGCPMIAATLFAAALLAVLPDAHVVAGQRSGSGWFRDIGPSVVSVYTIGHQIALEGMLAGFSTVSMLPSWVQGFLGLSSMKEAFDVPLWTLHVEFCGSLMVMMLVAARFAMSPKAYRIVCAILVVDFALSPMILFIIGHMVADYLTDVSGPQRRIWPGCALLAAGILLCSVKTVAPIAAIWAWLPPPSVGVPGDAAVLQTMIGALAIFAGFCRLPSLQRRLAQAAPRWLGKISFSLYLIHYPVLCTAVAFGFNHLITRLPYGFSIAVASAGGFGLTIVIAILFERWIDRPSITLSRTVGRLGLRKRQAVPAIAVG